MGKHSGNKRPESTTDQGKPFGQMSGSEKAEEFDSSHKNPRGYAARNFGDDNSNNRREGKGGRHAK